MKPSSTTRAAPIALGLLVCLGATGCKQEPQRAMRQYPVTFNATTEDGELLADVTITTGHTNLGSTDQKGRLRALLKGFEGQEQKFEVTCPTGYSSSEADAPAIQLRSHTGGSSAASEVVVRCHAEQRLAAVLVSTPGLEGLPVLVHGREVARTDAFGTAHVALTGLPQTPMRVMIDTSSRPRITPASPHKDVRLSGRDEIVVFAPELVEVAPPKPKVKRKVKEKEPEPPPVVVKPEELR